MRRARGCATGALPLVAADLIARGVPAGPAIGRGLAAARATWLGSGCDDGEETRQSLIAVAIEAAAQP